MGHSTARAITCASCGGKIAVAGHELPSSVTCPYCKAVQTISEGQRSELARYQADVENELARAEQERDQLRTWDRWYGGRGGRSGAGIGASLAIFGVIAMSGIALAFVAQTMMTSGDPSLRPLANMLPAIGVPVIAVVTIVAYSVWYYGGERRKRAGGVPARTLAKCPRCGAESALAPGQILERCSHCGASLVPSSTMMDRGFGAAEAARRRAELDRYRAERRGMATVIKSSAGNIVPYIVVGSFLPMTFGGAIAFTVDGIQKGKMEPGLGLLWAIAGANVIPLVFVYLWRRGRRERLRWVAESAAARYVHRTLDFDGFVAWLNAHWAGPVALTEIYSGAYFHATSMVVGEYLALLVLNPSPIAEAYPGYAVVYLAAWVPAMHGRGTANASATAAERTALDALGFRVTVDGAGIRAYAQEPVAKAIAFRREDGGAILARVATTLAEIARKEHATPIELPPED